MFGARRHKLDTSEVFLVSEMQPGDPHVTGEWGDIEEEYEEEEEDTVRTDEIRGVYLLMTNDRQNLEMPHELQSLPCEAP